MKQAITILLLVLVLVSMMLILPMHGQNVGEECEIDGFLGECKLLRDCSKVYDELSVGKSPSEHCGFLGFEPIVCCPITLESAVRKIKTCNTRDCIMKHRNEFLVTKSGCGFSSFDRIACCLIRTNRTISKSTPTPQPQTTIQTDTIQPLNSNGTVSVVQKKRSSQLERLLNSTGIVGSVAQAKCTENAEALYRWKIPSTWRDNLQLCDQLPHFVKKNFAYLTSDACLTSIRIEYSVAGGEEAKEKEFPHMAAVGFDGPENKTLWNCGGSLISAKVVLTAAHCTWSRDWGSAKWVRVDIVDLSLDDKLGGQTIAIKERIIYPDYRFSSNYHDIAILRLEQEVTYNDWVIPACLPVNLPDVGQNELAVATGWGLLGWDGNKSDHLMKVELRLVPRESCNLSFYDDSICARKIDRIPWIIVNKWQIRAGEKGKDTCEGDSGGPLSVMSNCMHTIIGVTSFGPPCGFKPGVYTGVYHYLSWIEKTAWPEYFEYTSSFL